MEENERTPEEKKALSNKRAYWTIVFLCLVMFSLIVWEVVELFI